MIASLPIEDREFLERRGYQWEAMPVEVASGGYEIDVVLHDFPLPEKYTVRQVDLLIRIPPGYPETGLDMFWTRPDVKMSATGQTPPSADVHEDYLGLTWQRWSRHLQAWRPGADGLESYLATVGRELTK